MSTPRLLKVMRASHHASNDAGATIGIGCQVQLPEARPLTLRKAVRPRFPRGRYGWLPSLTPRGLLANR